MALMGKSFGTIGAYTSDFWEGTVEVDFAPQPISASVWLFETIASGDFHSAVGVRSFEYRDTPDGPNKTVDFGDDYWLWPPTAWHPLMTVITFGISVGGNVECHGGFTLDYWS